MTIKETLKKYNYVNPNRRTNYYLERKKMSNVFQVIAIQERETKSTILVDVTTVVAENQEIAVQNFNIDNAKTLKGKIGVKVLARPFC